MAKCSWCSREMSPGTGTLFITLDGKTLRFCKRKCRIAFKLGRSKKLGWVRKKKKVKTAQ